MKQIINLHIQATSINSAYYNDKRLGYNAKTKKWIAEVCEQLRYPNNAAAMKSLRLYFDPKRHCFSVIVDYGTPAFFNKEKTVSAKSMDVGNITKTLLDVVFTEPFYGNETLKCENIRTDDKYITSLLTKKFPAEKHSIQITVLIQNLPVYSL